MFGLSVVFGVQVPPTSKMYVERSGTASTMCDATPVTVPFAVRYPYLSEMVQAMRPTPYVIEASVCAGLIRCNTLSAPTRS